MQKTTAKLMKKNYLDKLLFLAITTFAMLVLFTTIVHAKTDEVLKGPVWAQVIDIYDGDTIVVEANVWPGHRVQTAVRLNGYDTPELKARCDKESEMAKRAKVFVQDNLKDKQVMLENIHFGKYAGRVVADIKLPDGQSLGDMLYGQKLAAVYSGGKRKDWCKGSFKKIFF